MLIRINAFFDILEVIARRLPILHDLIVQLALIALAITGVLAILHHS